MSENGRTRQLIAKRQATIGSYIAPDYATDQDVSIYNLDDGSKDFGHTSGSDVANGTMAKGRSYSTRKTAGCSFETDFQPSGDIAVAPKWWKFLEGCGVAISTAGSNAIASWKGRPTCQTLDMDLVQWGCVGGGGTATVISSATGTFELSWDNSGAVVMPKFTFLGKYGGMKDVADTEFHVPSGVDTTAGATFLGATVEFGGYVHNVWAGTISLGADNQPVGKSDDVTNGVKTGISHIGVKGVDTQANLTVERVAKSTYDYDGDTVNNTVFATMVFSFDGFDVTLEGVQSIDTQNSTVDESTAFDITFKFDTFNIKQV